MSKQTKCIDDCKCPYCNHRFNGSEACIYDMDAKIVSCPKCYKEMEVDLSIKFMCTAIEGE